MKFRSYYAFSLAIALAAGAVFILFDIQWLKTDGEEDLRLYEESLIQLKKHEIKTLVDLVCQSIDIERGMAAGTPAERDAAVRARVPYKIKRLRAVEDGYFWINEVLNYEGGDNYARRLVHPNLPETEGSYLSTGIRDIEGRLPYLTELEGVKKDGELFQQYQFKKPGSETISLKLSYAKLYKDFNWIIATGVYLDDVQAQVAERRAELERRQLRQFFALSGFTLLVLSASIAAILAAGRRHYAAIAEQADRDILTGIGNRRAGQDRLIQTIAKRRRSSAGFCVLLCDLDHFKKINDAYGHAAGDAVLKTAAAAFSSELRALDSVFRWGGEEFLFIIADAAADEGERAAERLRGKLESAATHCEGVDIAVTATFGVAAYAGEKDYQDLVRRADAAMYRGKAEGRNRVVVAAVQRSALPDY